MLVADRLRGIPIADRVAVDPASPLAERGTVLAEPTGQEIVGQCREVADRPDAVLAQGRGRFRANAPQPGDRQRFEEDGLLAGWDDHEAVRFPKIRGDLGDELRRGDTDRCRQSNLSPNRGLDLSGDRLAIAEERPRTGHVDECFIDRDRLDERAEPPEDRHDVAADRLVFRSIDRQEHSLRTESAGLSKRHRRVDPKGTRLVARRADDAPLIRPAASDNYRPAAQFRPIALFDGSEERVQVDMKDGPRLHCPIIA